jgi:hypothetical protein
MVIAEVGAASLPLPREAGSLPYFFSVAALVLAGRSAQRAEFSEVGSDTARRGHRAGRKVETPRDIEHCVPDNPLKIAQRFSAGFWFHRNEKSRQGRKNRSAVPAGVCPL